MQNRHHRALFLPPAPATSLRATENKLTGDQAGVSSLGATTQGKSELQSQSREMLLQL